MEGNTWQKFSEGGIRAVSRAVCTPNGVWVQAGGFRASTVHPVVIHSGGRWSVGAGNSEAAAISLKFPLGVSSGGLPELPQAKFQTSTGYSDSPSLA